MGILVTFCLLLSLVQCHSILFTLAICYGMHLLFVHDSENFIENISSWITALLIPTLLTCFVWAPIYIVEIWIRDVEKNNFHIYY